MVENNDDLSVDTLIISLKDKEKEIKKLKKIEPKLQAIEQRYKEKLGDLKVAKKQIEVLQQFVEFMVPIKIHSKLQNENGIYDDYERMKSVFVGHYGVTQDILEEYNILKEEKEHLKQKVAELAISEKQMKASATDKSVFDDLTAKVTALALDNAEKEAKIR